MVSEYAAIQATFSDWKNVKTRKVVQLIFEVPSEQTEAVMKALGVPQPDKETWCAIARLNLDRPDKQRQRWDDMKPSQQAGMMCNDERFIKWAEQKDADGAASYVRAYCHVPSRKTFDTDRAAAERWQQLVTRYRRETGLETEPR